MKVHVVQFGTRNRAAAAALGVAALVIGGVLLALGITLLAGAVVVGSAVAGGVMLYRRLTGKRGAGVRAGLDPRMEVFAEPTRGARRLGGPDER